MGPRSVTQEQCKDSEKALDQQNEEMMKLVMERYNEMSQTMEEEKKAKLEQLYDQIVSFQESTDSAKETMETTRKEMEEAEELAFLLVSVTLLKYCQMNDSEGTLLNQMSFSSLPSHAKTLI